VVKDTKRSRRLWQGLRTITNYRGRTPSTVSAEASLTDDLNSFYPRFKASNNNVSSIVAEMSSIARDGHTLSVTDMRRALIRVNSRKAAGPDVVS